MGPEQAELETAEFIQNGRKMLAELQAWASRESLAISISKQQTLIAMDESVQLLARVASSGQPPLPHGNTSGLVLVKKLRCHCGAPAGYEVSRFTDVNYVCEKHLAQEFLTD